MQLDGASILVAGASGGLGSRIASQLETKGARLTLVARRAEPLEELPVAGARLAADLRLPSGCEAAVDTAVGTHGRLDGVVNAAGVVAFGNLEEASSDAIEELFLSNALLPAFLFQAALPRLSDGGTLVNLSGVAATRPMAGLGPYSASKAAASALMTALRREVRRRSITVIDARPGHTETALSTHPIEGAAPRFPAGLDPDAVAARVVSAIEAGESELDPDAFP